MQSWCGVPLRLRACVVSHFPSLIRTFRLRLPPFSSLSFHSSSSSPPSSSSSSSSSSYGDGHVALALPIESLKGLIRHQPRPDLTLALLSLLFVLSMACGALLSLALLSIPTIQAKDLF